MKRFCSLISSGLVFGMLGGCTSPGLTTLCTAPPGATPAQMVDAQRACLGCSTSTIVAPRRRDAFDILFVVDNSPSMAPKQQALAAALPSFVAGLHAAQIDYHIGVVTTNLGINVANGTATGAPFPSPVIPACNTAAGDDGVLQNVACTNRGGSSAEDAAACATACPDPSYLPQNGGRYITLQDGLTNVPQLMQGGADQGPTRAFECMALVGSGGCGISQPLEAARRALDGHRPENAGFNRGTSGLAIIFITDQDDCSVQQVQRSLLNPQTPNEASVACNAPSQSVDAQCYNLGYRCLALDLACAQPMNAAGAKTACSERTDSFLTSLDQYVSFFSSLPNPSITLAGIWPPSLLDNPTADPTKDGQFVVDLFNGTMDSAHLRAGQGTHAACNNPDPSLTSDPQGFFGQSQLRLSSFIRRFRASNIIEHSICDPNNYADVMTQLATNITNDFIVNCLPSVPATTNGVPACVVGYVDASNPHSTPDIALPVCSATCCNFFATDSEPFEADDPNLMPNPHLSAKLAACTADPDCYCATPSTINCQNGAVAGLWRAGNAPSPVGKVVNFQCAVMPGTGTCK
jgi:hypothetical protein